MNLARPADRIRARARRVRLARCPWAGPGAAAPGAGPTAATREPDLGTAGTPPGAGSAPRESTRETATRDSI